MPPKKRASKRTHKVIESSDEEEQPSKKRSPDGNIELSEDSSSDSDIETYLKPASKIDFNSSFFNPSQSIETDEKDKSNSQETSAIGRLSDSESSEEINQKNESLDSNRSNDLVEAIPSTSSTIMDFQYFSNYNEKFEKAKQQVELYKAKRALMEPEEMDVEDILQKEEKAFYSSLGSGDFHSFDDENKSDWEEVEEKEDQALIRKEGVEITIEAPTNLKKKKSLDLMAAIKRRMNRMIKEKQVYVHKVHLLCWIAHGFYVNTALNDENVLAIALSMLPSQQCYPSNRIDLSYLENIVQWYRKMINYKDSKEEIKGSLEKVLEEQILKKEASNRKIFIYIFVCILRSLGVKCRVVFNLQLQPLRPPVSELHSLNNSKGKEEPDKIDEKKDIKPQKKTVTFKINNSKLSMNCSSKKLVQSKGHAKKEPKNVTKSKPNDKESKNVSKSTKKSTKATDEKNKGDKNTYENVTQQNSKSVLGVEDKKNKLKRKTSDNSKSVDKTSKETQRGTDKNARLKIFSKSTSKKDDLKAESIPVSRSRRNSKSPIETESSNISETKRNIKSKTDSTNKEKKGQRSLNEKLGVPKKLQPKDPINDDQSENSSKSPNIKTRLRRTSKSPSDLIQIDNNNLTRGDNLSDIGNKTNSKSSVKPGSSNSNSNKVNTKYKTDSTIKETKQHKVLNEKQGITKKLQPKCPMNENQSTNSSKSPNIKARLRSTSKSPSDLIQANNNQIKGNDDESRKNSKNSVEAGSSMNDRTEINIKSKTHSTNKEKKEQKPLSENKSISKKLQPKGPTNDDQLGESSKSPNIKTRLRSMSKSPSDLMKANSNQIQGNDVFPDIGSRQNFKSSLEAGSSQNDRTKSNTSKTDFKNIEPQATSSINDNQINQSKNKCTSKQKTKLKIKFPPYRKESPVKEEDREEEEEMKPQMKPFKLPILKIEVSTPKKESLENSDEENFLGFSPKEAKKESNPDGESDESDFLGFSEGIPQFDGGADTPKKKPNLKKLNSSPKKMCSKKHRPVLKQTKSSTSDSEDEFRPSPSTSRTKSHFGTESKSSTSSWDSDRSRFFGGSSKRLDVRDDIIGLVKSSLEKERLCRKRTVPKSRPSADDSDYIPEKVFKERKGTKVKRRIPMKKDLIRLEKERLREKEEEKRKKGVNVWVEVFAEAEEKWISVDLVKGQVHCVKEIYSRATHPISYIFGFDNDNYVKDITKRYCENWNTVTRKLRVDNEWLEKTMQPYRAPKNAREREEDEDLARQQLDQPLPKTISEYKNHPLYVLKRHLLKFEAIYPANALTLGFVRNEPVYSRECVYTLHSRDIWLKHAKVVKQGEEPYKIVKARPRYDKLSNQIISDQMLEIFGPWQIQDYEPPTAENGNVPKNAYGNVDLFKKCMLPKGTVHLQFPGLNKVARKLNIDCAPAVTGFDFHGGWSHPVFDGFVVCEEFSEQLLAAWVYDQEEQAKKEEEKTEKRIYDNWKKLIKGLLIRERLKARYGFGNPEKKDKSEKKDQSESSGKSNKKS